MKALEVELKELKINLNNKDKLIDKLNSELSVERGNNIELLEEKNKAIEQFNKEKQTWQYESEKIGKELAGLKELNLSSQIDSEKKLKTQYELEKRELLSELDLEKTAYQKLLSDQYQLQARLEELEGYVNIVCIFLMFLKF